MQLNQEKSFGPMNYSFMALMLYLSGLRVELTIKEGVPLQGLRRD
jgi:hypothetical protein